MVLEAFTALKWKKDTSWTEGQPNSARQRALRVLGRGFAEIDSQPVLDAHRSAMKRLSKDKALSAAQVGIGSFMAAARPWHLLAQQRRSGRPSARTRSVCQVRQPPALA